MPSTNLETRVMSPVGVAALLCFILICDESLKKESEKNGKTSLYFTSMTLTVRTHSPDRGGLGLTNTP